jgi:hypothetical protein
MKKKNNKKWKVEFSDEVLNKYKDLPDEVSEEFEKLILGLKKGEIDPTKIGQPVNWVELDIRLKCPECKSKDVEWLFDKNSNEVTFNCLKCSESFWMTKEEYENAVKKNPNGIIK